MWTRCTRVYRVVDYPGPVHTPGTHHHRHPPSPHVRLRHLHVQQEYPGQSYTRGEEESGYSWFRTPARRRNPGLFLVQNTSEGRIPGLFY